MAGPDVGSAGGAIGGSIGSRPPVPISIPNPPVKVPEISFPTDPPPSVLTGGGAAVEGSLLGRVGGYALRGTKWMIRKLGWVLVILDPFPEEAQAPEPSPEELEQRRKELEEMEREAQQQGDTGTESCQPCAEGQKTEQSEDESEESQEENEGEKASTEDKSKKKGTRTKNRLPDGKDGNNGPPNGKLEKTNPQTGERQQIRYYDEYGKPKKDIDYGHDHGAGDPHVHDWKYESPQAPNPSRQPGRPPHPGELP